MTDCCVLSDMSKEHMYCGWLVHVQAQDYYQDEIKYEARRKEGEARGELWF